MSVTEKLPDLPIPLSPESSLRLIRKPWLVLREIRELTGTKVEQISQATGITLSRIVGFESGETSPTKSELEQIAKFYDADAAELLATFGLV